MSLAPGTIRAGEERLGRVFRSGGTRDLRRISDFAACLMPLVSALGWAGPRRELAEAMPHFAETLDLAGFRNTLANLQFRSRPLRLRLSELEPRLAPCLFVPDEGAPLVLLRPMAGPEDAAPGSRWYEIYHARDGLTAAETTPSWGTAYFFSPMEREEARAQDGTWMARFARRFRGLILRSLAVAALLNVLALASPLFVMAIYDAAIASGSAATLGSLALGMALALGADAILRALRARGLAFAGARIEMLMATAVFEHLLHLSPGMTERAPVAAQMSRLKEFETVRELIAGPLGVALADLPFAILFILAIAAIAGPIALVPLALLAAFAALGFALFPLARTRVRAASAAGARRQSVIVDTVANVRSIKAEGAETSWRARFRDRSAEYASAKFDLARAQSLLLVVSTTLMASAGLGTLAWGAVRVTDQAMTAGALIAAMTLVWRALAPLHAGFMALPRLEQAWNALHHINGLMRLRPEREPRTPSRPPAISGAISFRRVSMRYSPESEPAMLGVSFDAAPSECIAFAGPSGAGKSTVLKLIAGLYAPQAGAVLIDGIDLRQYDPIALRQCVAYLPQDAVLFHGTIAQNLRLAEPAATDEQLREAAAKAGVLADIEDLPERFETRVGDQSIQRMPASFRQRLQLARIYLKRARIVLLDEPGRALDEDGDAALKAAIQALKGRATVVIVTHRPSHMALADRVIVLEDGAVRVAGATARVMPHILGEYK